MYKLKKYFIVALVCICLSLISSISILAATDTYTVQTGDSLWIISCKYKVGLSEIIDVNPQFDNPHLIYPGDKVIIPLPDPEMVRLEEEVVGLVNKERSKYGLQPLSINWQLSRVAKYKSDDMSDNNYFSHDSSKYGSPFHMIKSFNIPYQTAGENIAKGQKTAKNVVSAWLSSEGHRKNILNPEFTEIGVGYSEGDSTYWTQLFIKP